MPPPQLCFLTTQKARQWLHLGQIPVLNLLCREKYTHYRCIISHWSRLAIGCMSLPVSCDYRIDFYDNPFAFSVFSGGSVPFVSRVRFETVRLPTKLSPSRAIDNPPSLLIIKLLRRDTGGLLLTHEYNLNSSCKKYTMQRKSLHITICQISSTSFDT